MRICISIWDVCVVQLHVSVIFFFFWEIQKAPLATVFLYVFLFVFFFSHPWSITLCLNNKISQVNTFPPLHSELPRLLTGSPPNRRKKWTFSWTNIFSNLRRHIPFGVSWKIWSFFFSPLRTSRGDVLIMLINTQDNSLPGHLRPPKSHYDKLATWMFTELRNMLALYNQLFPG